MPYFDSQRFISEAGELTDAEFRTHVDALCWASRQRLSDLHVPKADLGQFATSPDAPAAASGLLAKGWWGDRGSAWFIGLRDSARIELPEERRR